jgi:hypothetical protein
MTIPTLPALPNAPQRTDLPDDFVSKADAWNAALETYAAALNAWAAAVALVVSGVDFNGTSATSNTVGTGSKTWTTQSGKLWQVGQFVVVADSVSPANYCFGQVTAYSGTSLTVNVTAIGGSGTKTAWSIGIAPAAGAYATLGGSETLTNKTIALGSNSVSGTLAQFNTAVTDADLATLAGSETLTTKSINLANNTLTGTSAQFNTACSDADFATLAGAEGLTNKTLTDPAIVGAILEDIYTITDGAAFEIDPGNGTVQDVTLGANRTPKGTNFSNGESITLLVDDGTARTLTWTDTTFGASGVKWIGTGTSGGAAPTLATTGWTVIILWKRAGQVYGSLAGYTG